MGKVALERIRVVDFTISGVGPLVTKYLADFGAEVIKVESIERPDITRVSLPYKDGIPGLNRSGAFLCINSSSHSINVNLKTEEGKDLIRRLIAAADVVVESSAPGIMEKLGLAYGDLKKIKSDIIMLSTCLQGQHGPHARVLGWGFQGKGLAGFVHLTGWPDREPSGTWVMYTDVCSPWYVAVAAMAALIQRHHTGKGQHIDVSQIEASLPFLSPWLLDYSMNGRVGSANGNRCAHACPHGIFRCRGEDKWCAIGVFTDEEWQAFYHLVGAKWCQDARFAIMLGRKENEDELERLVESWTAKYLAEDLMLKLQEAGIAAGVVQTCQDILEHDPQLKHRHYFRLLEHPEMGLCHFQDWLFHLSKTPAQIERAPLFGEHTERVLTQVLEISNEDYIKLLEKGVLE